MEEATYNDRDDWWWEPAYQTPTNGLRPVITLNSEVKISSGSGSSTDPYILVALN